MSYHAFFLSTRWGRAEGGLNVFNKGLAEGAAEVLKGAGRCYCLVEEAPPPHESAVRVVTYDERSSPERTAAQIRGLIAAAGEVDDEADVVVVGHDVHTGQLAIDCARLLHGHFRCQSAVIRHMHYRQYAVEKGVSDADLARKTKLQEAIVQGADRVFAVGPLLTDASHGGDGQMRPIVGLIPGATMIEARHENLEPGWQVFMSGRLGAADDRIKNSTLAVRALRAAYEKIRAVKGAGTPELASRGTLHLMGSDPVDRRVDDLRAITGQYFSIDAQPYLDDEATLFDTLTASHFAMMPSWHEGFGLTGWEAICAGIPLVCTRHSGLYQFLERSVWAEHPDVPRESIFSVDLVGRTSAGEVRPEDIESIAQAILDVHLAGQRARKAALELSKHVQSRYRWADCARTLVDALEWPLPSSDNWRDRQAVAARREDFVEPDSIADDELIKTCLEIVGQRRAFLEWQTVCSALNLLSSRGKVWKGTTGLAALMDMAQISADIEAATGEGRAINPIRSSGGLDLVWRLLGAASSVTKTLSEFNSLIGPHLWSLITADSFLLREFFYYSCRFADDFEADGDELLDRLRSLESDQLRDAALQVRLGRLAGRHVPFGTLLERGGVLSGMPDAVATAQSVARLIENEGEWSGEVGDAANLLWLLAETAPTGANGPRMSLDYVKELHGDGAIPKRWRGDRRFEAAALLAGLPPGALFETLDRLARDEDESLRWACLDLCFSRSLRNRIACGAQRLSGEALRRRLGEIVDVAVSQDAGHPWLQREFLDHYRSEVSCAHSSSTSFTLEDFPASRRLLGPIVHSPGAGPPERLHPEVTAARAAALEHVKRILLVLPPIQPGEAIARPASHTTTPALGLGLVASALASAGHDVQIVDCHRYPDQLSVVIDQAATFDWLGLNVVLSTVRSALYLLGEVRERSLKPLVVVGGPAVNLGAWRRVAEQLKSNCWDFEVRGDGEQLLPQLVGLTDSEGAWPEIPGVTANMYSPLTIGRCETWSFGGPPTGRRREEWSPPVVLDRRIFRGPGGSYEPAATRRQAAGHMEAHVVMSKGCDWNCTFCTERWTLSGGERRRDVGSVLNEVRLVSEAHGKIHLQFIDDNLLPQVAATEDPVVQAKCVAWANAFLAGLIGIRTTANTEMRWRGIFRIEDFLRYKELLPDFLDRLAQSGCQMLAFGVEHGNEARRQKLKASSGVTNEEIKQLFSELKHAGIDTKGYFILGGHKETVSLGEETIRFAIESGVTLAYFALYKDFVRASTQLERNSVRAGQTSDEFLSYDQLWLDLDEQFSAVDRQGGDVTAGPYTLAEKAELRIYAKLQRLGFRFEDLVKYNDYHSHEGNAGVRAKDLYYNDAEAYLNLVRYAYSAFYLRPYFVTAYERLVASGY